MKKSEILNHIKNELQEIIKQDRRRSPKDTGFLDRKAASMLDMLEGFGMLPPDHFVNGHDNMFDESVKIRMKNCWEPEEE